jgi:hypothetical protein
MRPSIAALRPWDRQIGVLLAATVLLVGCSASPAPQDDGRSDGDVEEVEDPIDERDTAAPDRATDDGDTGAAAPVADERPPRPDLGLPPMTLLTATDGEGPRPVLEWEPVDGATSYAVSVYAGVGEPARWSWRGDDTSVRVGFVEDPSVGGPNVIAGMTWGVLALDANGEPIAQSNERPLGP